MSSVHCRPEASLYGVYCVNNWTTWLPGGASVLSTLDGIVISISGLQTQHTKQLTSYTPAKKMQPARICLCDMSVCPSVCLSVRLWCSNFYKFILSIHVQFVYQGHRVKVKVTEAKSAKFHRATPSCNRHVAVLLQMQRRQVYFNHSWYDATSSVCNHARRCGGWGGCSTNWWRRTSNFRSAGRQTLSWHAACL